MKQLLGSLDVKNKKVLEVGAGIGTDGVQLARNGGEITELELSRESLGLAEKNFIKAGEGGNFVQGDAENLPFPNDSFDIYYSYGVLHHTPNTSKAIEEAWRVLKPGGRAVIMLYNKYSWYYLTGVLLRNFLRFLLGKEKLELGEITDQGVPISKVFSKGEGKKILKSAGFKEVKANIKYIMRIIPNPFRDYMPLSIEEKLKEIFNELLGWHLILEGKK